MSDWRSDLRLNWDIYLMGVVGVVAILVSNGVMIWWVLSR